ncbi:MAG: phosphodiester glycosidase family protein [Anaerolineae bacterium]|nr:phosphodiester glycosidase family protein [Anaerolineae bacterium]
MYQLTNLPIYLLCLALLLVSGCTFFTPPATPTPVPTPTPIPLPSPVRWPTITPEPPDTGWLPLQPGVELRRVLVETAAASPETEGEYLAIVRLDPSAVRFRVHYDPSQPLKVRTWAEQLDALLVVNGGYFTPEYEATGLLVSDGQKWGAVYGDFAGLFAVTADEQVSIRWLHDRPYDPAEPLAQGVMSFPVLVKPGGVMGFPADADDGMHARRTIVAQDSAGRILFIAAPRGALSLHEMAVFLTESDLEIDVALNLDGGPSTGLWLQSDENPVGIDSRAAVPSVISIETH